MNAGEHLSWDHLQSFLAVARDGTLSAAARSLQVTQSTMSRRLDALHLLTGSRLLDKTPDGYRLTRLGHTVLDAVEAMEAHAFSVERFIVREEHGLAGEVRVTTVESFGARVVMPMLAPLLAATPGIAVELITDIRDLSLARRECDVALRLAQFERHEVVVHRVGTMAFGLYASAEYLSAHGDPGRSASTAHSLVTSQQDLADKPEATGLLERVPGGVVRVRANSRQVQLEAVAAGCGIGLLPCHMAAGKAGLVEIAHPAGRVRRGIWLGVHRDNCDVPRIRLVIDQLTRGIKAAANRIDPPA